MSKCTLTEKHVSVHTQTHTHTHTFLNSGWQRFRHSLFWFSWLLCQTRPGKRQYSSQKKKVNNNKLQSNWQSNMAEFAYGLFSFELDISEVLVFSVSQVTTINVITVCWIWTCLGNLGRATNGEHFRWYNWQENKTRTE